MDGQGDGSGFKDEEEEVSTLRCLYCRASVNLAGLSTQRYQDHLRELATCWGPNSPRGTELCCVSPSLSVKEHNVLFDMEAVVERTLRSQVPSYAAQFPQGGVGGSPVYVT